MPDPRPPLSSSVPIHASEGPQRRIYAGRDRCHWIHARGATPSRLLIGGSGGARSQPASSALPTPARSGEEERGRKGDKERERGEESWRGRGEIVTKFEVVKGKRESIENICGEEGLFRMRIIEEARIRKSFFFHVAS